MLPRNCLASAKYQSEILFSCLKCKYIYVFHGYFVKIGFKKEILLCSNDHLLKKIKIAYIKDTHREKAP